MLGKQLNARHELHTLSNPCRFIIVAPISWQVKATNGVFLKNISGVKGGEKVLLASGWRPLVVDMQKQWCFEGSPGSLQWDSLSESHSVVQKAQQIVQDKAGRKRQEEEAKKSRATAEKQRILIQIEDDKALRSFQPPVQGPVAATPLPSEAAPKQAPGYAEEEEDEDKESDEEL